LPVRRGSRARGASEKAVEQPSPTYRISTYTVFPSGYDAVDDPDRSRWCLTVADADGGWVIRRDEDCLSIFNQWVPEAPPGARDAEFHRTCLYNEHAALLRARRVVDNLEVGGLTFEEFVWRLASGTPDA
jgi:hypothetical protein